MKKIIKKILKIARKTIVRINPVLGCKIMYFKQMKKRLNLKNPTTFNEKINYLKLYVFPKDKKVIKCADKYKVREYLEKRGLSKNLCKLYFAWDSADEIEWKKLPKQFVLKCNHGCGYNIICKDKNKLDVEHTKNKLNKWMKEDFGKVSGEPHYNSIPKKIICEEYLGKDIMDYKFFCFNGKSEFFYISQSIDGQLNTMRANFFNLDGTKADFSRTDHLELESEPILPDNLNEMIKLAEQLSKEFPFVRVDLFNVKGKIYFSELTFTPCAGFMPFSPAEADEQIGKLIDLNKYKA